MQIAYVTIFRRGLQKENREKKTKGARNGRTLRNLSLARVIANIKKYKNEKKIFCMGCLAFFRLMEICFFFAIQILGTSLRGHFFEVRRRCRWKKKLILFRRFTSYIQTKRIPGRAFCGFFCSYSNKVRFPLSNRQLSQLISNKISRGSLFEVM